MTRRRVNAALQAPRRKDREGDHGLHRRAAGVHDLKGDDRSTIVERARPSSSATTWSRSSPGTTTSGATPAARRHRRVHGRAGAWRRWRRYGRASPRGRSGTSIVREEGLRPRRFQRAARRRARSPTTPASARPADDRIPARARRGGGPGRTSAGPRARSRALSLRPVAERLGELLGRPVRMTATPSGPRAGGGRQAAPGDVVLLENVRFHAEEEKNDPGVREGARGGSRPLRQRRLRRGAPRARLDRGRGAHPARVRRAAAWRKSSALCRAAAAAAAAVPRHHRRREGEHEDRRARALLRARVDRSIGGGMANTFLPRMGRRSGKAWSESDRVDEARRSWTRRKRKRCVCCRRTCSSRHDPSPRADAGRGVDEVAEDRDAIVDIGPRTIERYAEELAKAKTIFWNGPIGVFEIPPFATGTNAWRGCLAASARLVTSSAAASRCRRSRSSASRTR